KLALMLGHELAHLRRRDLHWNLLIRITQVVFFFHPVVWFADREHRSAREVACDELAVAILNCGPKAYAEMLLQVVSTLEPNRRPSLTIGIGESFQNLKTRLEALNEFCRKTPRQVATTAALVSFFGFMTLVQWKLVALAEVQILPVRPST